MEQHFLEWLVHYGAPVLFAAQVLGIFGLPIPDEFLLTLSGALVKKGDLSLVPVVARGDRWELVPVSRSATCSAARWVSSGSVVWSMSTRSP